MLFLTAVAIAHSGHSLRAPQQIARVERFDRPIFACNAFPDEQTVSVTRNRKHVLEPALAYKECKKLPAAVEEGDQLDFESSSAGTWTFRVGALPEANSRLLLVFEKRSRDSKVPSFQSFAFPPTTHDAQLAIIDAYKGDAQRTGVRLQDAPMRSGNEAVAPAARTEDLDYDHVYALGQGDYDASMLIDVNSTEVPLKQHLKMREGDDYVLLRLGGEGFSHAFDEELVAVTLSTKSAALVSALAAFVLLQ